MVWVSHEQPAQTDARLRSVIRSARVEFYEDAWFFEEFPVTEFAQRANPKALAMVRDDNVWSQLLPYRGQGERFALFRFHFPSGVDNSGFVGWLATLLKEELGTGVFVTCGCNGLDGGIFDYWGIPDALRERGFAMVRRLCGLAPPP
jgi:Family of unknown function (DUF6196)